MINLLVTIVAFLSFGSAQAVERGAPVNYIFTTQVLKINRTTGQMIVTYSEAGKSGVRKDRVVQLNNYDKLERELTAKITKVHETKPWIIIQVLSGDYKEIEKGFRYKTQFIKGVSQGKPSTPQENRPQ